MFTLHERETNKMQSRGLSCDQTGVHFGECQLTAPDRLGRYRVREIGEINSALSAGYGFPVNVGDRLPAPERLAKLLSDGHQSLAEIATLQPRLPDLADEDAANRLRSAEQLLRFNPNHRPAGPGGGQFTSGSESGSAPTTWTTTRSGARVNHDPGVAVALPDGRPVADTASATGHLMSPVANLADVAETGREVGDTYRKLLYDPDTAGPAIGYFGEATNANVGQGGVFDYQRLRDRQGFMQRPQFRAVANFNVGLFMQQTGASSLDETLRIAGGFAGFRSSNARPDQPYGLDPITAYWIRQGYQAGESGVFGRPARR